MLLGVIADDYTGASDIANTIAKGGGGTPGLATVQFLGIPKGRAPESCEAGVVALKSRSIPAGDAVAQSLAALRWLQAQGCRQIVFKYCSTFDSTPDGNIGPVAEALARALGVHGVVACPAFPGAGRTVYQGHLFVGDRLLSQSGLENHPLNPMTDADIRRWLRRQTETPVGIASWNATVAKGAAALQDALAEAAGRGETLVIVDAISDDDLLTIGEAVADAPLLTGGSGVALGLSRNFIRKGLAKGAASAFRRVDGPEAILAGSCSRATLGQIAHHKAQGHPVLPIDVAGVMSGAVVMADLVGFLVRNAGRAPLVFSSSPPDEVAALQARFGREAVAHRLDSLFAETARAAVDGGIRRLVVAGGETSGAVVSALGLEALAIGPEIDPGVPALSNASGVPLAVALKSGNFGAVDFFAKALATLGGEA
ncbi:MAG TPA: four-carbon acid sugar kinase family protein [Beijerinckiaceae bacterium]|nr:four-carbon acid sugar kinase family protein [Beijerinckiaceae bacterium]